MNKLICRLILLAAMSITSSCAHSLTVKNLDSYKTFTANSLKQPLSLGIVPVGKVDQKLLNGIAGQLGAFQAKVIMPYTASARQADVVAVITVDSKYDGSGWNFLISFPGFLIFAPVWNGYVYEVTHAITVQLKRGLDNEHIDKFTLPVVLDIRHSDIDRTWVMAVDWLLTYGVVSIVGGIIYVNYDDDVTPLLADRVSIPIGTYVAQEIVNRINEYGELGKLQPKAITPMKANETRSVTDRLAELKKLKDNGVITDEEYKQKKDAIMEDL